MAAPDTPAAEEQRWRARRRAAVLLWGAFAVVVWNVVFDAVVIEAGSGEEALQLFGSEHPDWVIMDLRMPGMGGIKATEAIHHLDASARVIVISQFTEPEWGEQARQAGAVGVVSKEHLAQLVSIIDQQSPLQP